MKTVRTPDLLTKAGWAWHATIYCRGLPSLSRCVKLILAWEPNALHLHCGKTTQIKPSILVSKCHWNLGAICEVARHNILIGPIIYRLLRLFKLGSFKDFKNQQSLGISLEFKDFFSGCDHLLNLRVLMTAFLAGISYYYMYKLQR